MDKKLGNARISITAGTYAISRYRENVTQLEVVNMLCKEAGEQNKDIIRATVKMEAPSSIIKTGNKSL